MGSEQRLQGGEDPSLPIDESAVTIEGQQVEVGGIQHGASLLRPFTVLPAHKKRKPRRTTVTPPSRRPNERGRYARRQPARCRRYKGLRGPWSDGRLARLVRLSN